MAGETIPRSFRFKPDDWDEITRRAAKHSLSATAYITRTALGTLEADDSVITTELEAIKERLQRLESQAFGY